MIIYDLEFKLSEKPCKRNTMYTIKRSLKARGCGLLHLLEQSQGQHATSSRSLVADPLGKDGKVSSDTFRYNTNVKAIAEKEMSLLKSTQRR